MIKLHIHYNNRTEYRCCDTLWAANLIAINIMRNDRRVLYVDVVDHKTGVVEKHYIRG
jgi:hypothetical protein